MNTLCDYTVRKRRGGVLVSRISPLTYPSADYVAAPPATKYESMISLKMILKN